MKILAPCCIKVTIPLSHTKQAMKIYIKLKTMIPSIGLIEGAFCWLLVACAGSWLLVIEIV